jgi:hypothetical protein
MRAVSTFLLVVLSAAPAAAAERSFVLSPADLAQAVDQFNAGLVANSAAFGRQISIHGNAVRFFGRSCQTLTGDGGYAASRLRVLDGAGRAAAFAGRHPNIALGAALQSMGAASWSPPAVARTRQLSWATESVVPGAVGFATTGFASGDPTGALGAAAVGETTPSFLVTVDLTDDVRSEPAALVLALTTQLPPSRPGKMPKRSECFLVASTYPADVQALVDLLAATPLTEASRIRLSNILDDALGWLQKGHPQRAARAAKHFALEVASRSGAEIPTDAADQMVRRALLVTDALGL